LPLKAQRIVQEWAAAIKPNCWPIGSAALICYLWTSFQEQTSMIKITSCKPDGDLRFRLTFSAGSIGIWDAAPLLGSNNTLFTIPLREPQAFARAFIDNGALAWPNGLELAPWTLHQEMDAAGLLSKEAA